MQKGRVIYQINPSVESTLMIRILLALNATGKECQKSVIQLLETLEKNHGKKFLPTKIQFEILKLENNHLVQNKDGCYKLTSDARDQMEDLPTRCDKARWEHVTGLATTGGYRTYKHANHVKMVSSSQVLQTV